MLDGTTVAIEKVSKLSKSDLDDLCDAAKVAIIDGGGFGWITPPVRSVFERYWKGLLVVPGRIIFVGRLDGVIAASAQLHLPPPNNEAQSFAASVVGAFVAPWARGHGLGRGLFNAIEKEAITLDKSILRLDIRETQSTAIRLIEDLGYEKWGTNSLYSQVNGKIIAGYYYQKKLKDIF